ncbi:MAG: HlyD family efflux transporter periplasmic adaptor subunit [Phormidesmis sp. RL_2_1]|nr:HlyD family efflux transporter periplasmic adaptor subunit [Phormidesmis sp. RL_2_1]
MKLASTPIPPFQPCGMVPLSLREAAYITGGSITYPSGASAGVSSADTTDSGSAFRQPLRLQGSREKGGWSESVQAVLEQPPAALTRYLIGLGMIFSGVFLTWACVGHIQEVSHAQGRIIPQGETYKLQPVIEGKVDSILVKEGDTVYKNQVLLSLDAALLEADISRLEQAVLAAQKELAQVRSLIIQTQQESVASGQIATANTAATMANLQQSQSAVGVSEALLISLADEMNAHQERLARIRAIETQGAVSKEYLFGIEQNLRERQQAITQNQGELARFRAQTRQAEAELAQKQAEEQQIHILAQQSLQKLAMEEQQLQATIADLSTQLEQAKTKLSQSYVKASTDGIVSNLAIHNVGEVVQPGQVVAEVVPEDTPLILSAVVPPQEAGLLKVGMETQIKLDAFPYQNYGTLLGTVAFISPDAKAVTDTSEGYQVDVALAQDFVVHEQQQVRLQIGQTATAEVVVRRRRIIEILLDPIRQMRESELSI